MIVPQTWIIECLKMYEIFAKDTDFITKAIENWKVELAAGSQTLKEMKIQRDIFQGDVLSPQLQ